MKKTLMIAAMLAAPVVLSGCDKKAETPKAEASPDAMGSMAMPVAVKMAKGAGTVTAIDAAAGKITLDHGPVAELEWPAMKMGFAVKPDLMAAAAVGDKVAFEFEWNGKSGTITSLSKEK